MKLSKVKIKGFRNFKKAEINFNDKSLIIGANDVGKTNLLWAIRLLLDRGLSDYDIEPQDSDFYAFETTNTFEIILCFDNVVEDCVVAKLKGKISDDDKLFLAYRGFKDALTQALSYKILAGKSITDLEEVEDRFYRKVLNVKCISSKRDFHHFIKREKNYLFQIAKDKRTAEEKTDDDKLYSEIQGELKVVDDKIPKLKFISTATETINEELSKLSLHHQKQKIVFDATSSNVDNFISNVSISSKSEERNLLIGGDGRLNQIYLALWASRNGLTETNIEQVTIFCIEEPEAHLHPHQQRKLADYLNSHLKGQVIITSHSPQIACDFSPNSIIRLVAKNGTTRAATNGCSDIIDAAFDDFGYRLSIIPSEAFFSDIVFLVEGASELLFYNTLAKQLEIDLDRLNISILMVDGVGFSTYIKILNSLEIEWVLRTDNDIMKIPRKPAYRFAGVQRCIGFYKNYFEENKDTEDILKENEANLKGFISESPPKINEESAAKIIEDLKFYGMYIANTDLEVDLLNSEIKEDINKYFKSTNSSQVLKSMTKRKATSMYDFLREKKEALKKLANNSIAEPLNRCVEIINSIHETD